MRGLLLVSMLFVLIPVLAGSQANAVGCGCDGLKSAYIVSIEHAEQNYDNAKAILLAKPESEWTHSEQEDYLFWSMLLVYYANGLYLEENSNNHPSDDEILVNMGYLSEWPVNFYSGERLRIRSVDEGFYPGDVALEICPYEYSIRGKCASYSMFIFGPEEDWPISPVEPLPTNAAWSTVPLGAVHVTGLTTETDAERDERILFFRALLEKLASDGESNEAMENEEEGE